MRRNSLVPAAGAAALLAVVLLLAGAQVPAGGSGLSEPDPRLEWAGPLTELHRSLAGPLRSSRKSAEQAPELRARLVAPGAQAIAPLFDMLIQGRVPRTRPEDAPQLLSVPQRGLLLSALAGLPAAAVRAELERRLPKDVARADPALRVAALRVLSVIGTKSDLPGLPSLTPRDRDEIGPLAAEALREAYAAILRRDPELLSSGLKLLRASDDDARKQLLFAIGDAGDKRALPLFDSCIRTMPALAQQAVALIPVIGASGDPNLDPSLADWLGEHLDPQRTEWTRASLLAIGVLDNGSQVPVLLEAFTSEHPGLRRAALEALRRVSGLGLGDSLPPWREWYARELEWQENGRQRAREELESGQDELVARALDAYADHRLFREERAEDVLEVLDHGSPAMRVMACDALARIGSPRVLPQLVELISDDAAELAEAAWRASCSLSRQTLPRSTEEARELLAGG